MKIHEMAVKGELGGIVQPLLSEAPNMNSEVNGQWLRIYCTCRYWHMMILKTIVSWF